MTASTCVVAVLCGDHRPPHMDAVERHAEVVYATPATLPDALQGADVLFVWDFFSSALRDAWPAAERLRWVHVASAGVDRLLFPELVASDVIVTNSRGVFDRPIAEYVLALVLAAAKDLPRTLALQRERTWEHRETSPIEGRTVLVVGTGSIGRAIARLLCSVGMKVTGVGRTARSDDLDLGAVHSSSDLLRLLPDADYVVVSAPLTEETRGLFDGAAIGRMKDSAWLVNVGRGPIVVERDLVAALERGKLGGAALDVFTDEPLATDSPLWEMPNVIVSPHMSGDVFGWHEALVELFVTNFERRRRAQPLLNEVDKEAGYVGTAMSTEETR